MAMKYEVFMYIGRDNSKSFKKIRKELMKEVFQLGNDNEDDSDFEDDYIHNEDNEQFKRSSCKCELCTRINQVEDHWDSWIPKTELEKILKKNIDKLMVANN